MRKDIEIAKEEEEEMCAFLKKCGKAAKEEIQEAQFKISDYLGNGFKCMDTDKIVVFVRSVKFKGLSKIEAACGNNVFVELSFETQPKMGLLQHEMFIHRTGVKYDCPLDAEFPMLSQVHFQTTVPQMKRAKLAIKIFDLHEIMGECTIGEADVSLDELLRAGYGQDVEIPVTLQKMGFVAAHEASISLYAAAPFNWLTLGLPTCGADCTPTTSPSLFGAPCLACCNPDDIDSCCQKPGIANAFGCCHPNTCGTCHTPAGEKCASINAPDCTICAPNTPSLLNLCGFAMFDWPCAGENKGTAGSCKSCGKCGIPTCSMSCPCAHWGNCGVLPMKCKDGECELADCVKDVTCNGCEGVRNPFEPIEFEKAHVYINRATITTLDGRPFEKETKLSIKFGEFEYDSHHFGTKASNGDYKLGNVAFLNSSKNLAMNNIKVKVSEGGLIGGVIGEGEISLYSLLMAGFHNEIALTMYPGKMENGKEKPQCCVTLKMMLASDQHKPNPQRKAARASVVGRQKAAGFFYSELPTEIKGEINSDMFKDEPLRNITEAEERRIMEESITNEDVLVGYQCELVSKSTGATKGLWVIVGIKRVRFASTSYELKNLKGESRWDHIEKKDSRDSVKVSGKPIRLKRKVMEFQV